MNDSNHKSSESESEDQSAYSLPSTPGSDNFLPGSLKEDFPGKLIVFEGSDGSGRSTQISLLSEWLEWRGFATKTVGLKRSKLLAADLDALSRSNELQLLTQILLYATDFYDQIENVVIPSLRAGFIVLADRYTLTLHCRALSRGIPKEYLQNLYCYAPNPDLKLRLDVKPEQTFQRLFSRKSVLNHWEVGADLNLSDNLYDSFIEYQTKLNKSLKTIGERERYQSIDGSGSVREVNGKLRTELGKVLEIEELQYDPSENLRNLWIMS